MSLKCYIFCHFSNFCEGLISMLCSATLQNREFTLTVKNLEHDEYYKSDNKN